MVDVETIFDSDREEYEFMQEKKEKPMKEQIEEKHALSESIYMSGHGLDWKDSDDIAEQLYAEGYRKQKEGEWLMPASGEPWEGRSFGMCSVCGKVDDGFIEKAHKYCPNCGAKMKGGAE